ncbi:MAG: Do family serine endopeptidase [Candidatus Omnitrophica bacterium]|nr:Do family serine endopeptidase [Candidatus Omnitrophota bacterium]
MENKRLALLIGIIVVVIFSLAFIIVRVRTMPPREGIVPTVKIKGEIALENAFVKVAEKVGPAVVTISTERTQKIRAIPSDQLNLKRFGRVAPQTQAELEQFFRQFFGYLPERELKQQGLGSGFIIDKEGNVLTNYHVVAGAEKITVTLPDGRSFPGKIRGRDPRMDVALIKIDALDLPVVELGNSDNLKTGQWVIAIGNPFGHILKSPEPTITVGVISALHRHIPSDGARGVHFDMIQTDAAINLGNSGGPLCNMQGEVIGINVAIFSTSGGSQGVSFAMPITVIKNVLGELMEGKEVSYGWFGILVQDITPELAEYFKLPGKNGVLVAGIVQGGPAHQYGIRPGDVVIEYNGKKAENPFDLIRMVEDTEPGTVATIKLIRDRKVGTLKVKVGKRIYAEEIPKEVAAPTEQFESKPWRGVRVSGITQELANQLNLSDKNGVAIIAIDTSGPFYTVGLREGDVIREINKNPIRNISDFNRVAQAVRGKALIRTDDGFFIVGEK